MNILDLKSVLKTMIENESPITPMIWGRHGIGKSSAVRQVAAEVGYRCLSIILSQKEAVDVAGVLYTFADPELGVSVTDSHPPKWFADAMKKGNVILFFDEFNMARKEVMGAAFELILDKRLNNLVLPPSVFIVCGGNPDDERYDVTPMSESLRDRFVHIQVKNCVTTWLQWAKDTSSGVHPDVIKFIEQDNAALSKEDSKDEEFPVDLPWSQRSWERVSHIHKLPIPIPLKTELFRGVVGMDLARTFIKSFGNQDLPFTATELLNFAKVTKDRFEEYCNPDNMRTDLLTRSIDNLVSGLKLINSVTAKEMKNIKKIIKTLPDDIAQSLVNQIYELSPVAEEFKTDTDLSERVKQIKDASEAKAQKKAA